jgi:hypothetical protein
VSLGLATIVKKGSEEFVEVPTSVILIGWLFTVLATISTIASGIVAVRDLAIKW